MHKFGKLVSLAVALVLGPISSSAAPLMDFSVSGKGMYYAQTSLSTYYRDENKAPNYWDFCSNRCQGYPQGASDIELRNIYSGGLRIDEPGSLYGHGLNLSANGSPLSVTASGSAGPSLSSDMGYLNYGVSANLENLSALPEGKAWGAEIHNVFSHYVFRNPSEQTYKFSGTFNSLAVPEGFTAHVETIIKFDFHALWNEPDGTFGYFTESLVNATYRGSFEDEISLTFNLNDYPTPLAEYGSYSVAVLNRVVFSRNPSEIPEPATLALLTAGLVGVAVANQRRKRSIKPKQPSPFA